MGFLWGDKIFLKFDTGNGYYFVNILTTTKLYILKGEFYAVCICFIV